MELPANITAIVTDTRIDSRQWIAYLWHGDGLVFGHLELNEAINPSIMALPKGNSDDKGT